jgi:hypothetical protein
VVVVPRLRPSGEATSGASEKLSDCTNGRVRMRIERFLQAPYRELGPLKTTKGAKQRRF